MEERRGLSQRNKEQISSKMSEISSRVRTKNQLYNDELLNRSIEDTNNLIKKNIQKNRKRHEVRQ
jgi:hypothetical protein